jgi:hypothetical protein
MRLLFLGLASIVSLSAQSQNTHSARLSSSTIPRNPFLRATNDSIERVIADYEARDHAVFEVWVEEIPRQYMESISSGFVPQPDDFGDEPLERYVRDLFRKVYIRYAIVIQRDTQPGRYRVSFTRGQSAVPPEVAKDPEWKIIDPTPLPAPQILASGEALTLQLYSNPPSTRRIVDVIQVGTGPFPGRKEGARDVYADDAEMTIAKPKLRINGIPAELATTTLQGKSVRVAIPSHGTYTLALHPVSAEMKRAGEIEGQRLTFMAGSDVFRLDCADSIATGSGVYNVYVQPSR